MEQTTKKTIVETLEYVSTVLNRGVTEKTDHDLRCQMADAVADVEKLLELPEFKKPIDPWKVSRIAAHFGSMLKEDLGDVKFYEVVCQNFLNNDNTCHSGDVCDSNVVMARAFTAVMEYAPDSGSQRDADIWNAAWNEFKAAWRNRVLNMWKTEQALRIIWGIPAVQLLVKQRDPVVLPCVEKTMAELDKLP